jgi:hypothetical protein
MMKPARVVGISCVVIACFGFALSGTGCAMPRWTPNPSFVVTKNEAAADLERMQANPVAAQRPVVFLAGIGDLSISSGAIESAIEPTLDAKFAELHFFDEFTFDGARQKALREVAEQLGKGARVGLERDDARRKVRGEE